MKKVNPWILSGSLALSISAGYLLCSESKQEKTTVQEEKLEKKVDEFKIPKFDYNGHYEYFEDDKLDMIINLAGTKRPLTEEESKKLSNTLIIQSNIIKNCNCLRYGENMNYLLDYAGLIHTIQDECTSLLPLQMMMDISLAKDIAYRLPHEMIINGGSTGEITKKELFDLNSNKDYGKSNSNKFSGIVSYDVVGYSYARALYYAFDKGDYNGALNNIWTARDIAKIYKIPVEDFEKGITLNMYAKSEILFSKMPEGLLNFEYWNTQFKVSLNFGRKLSEENGFNKIFEKFNALESKYNSN